MKRKFSNMEKAHSLKKSKLANSKESANKGKGTTGSGKLGKTSLVADFDGFDNDFETESATRKRLRENRERCQAMLRQYLDSSSSEQDEINLKKPRLDKV